MMDDLSGRSVRTLEEAEDYIMVFVSKSANETNPHIKERSHDYDLYLPWLMEVVQSVWIKGNPDLPKLTDLEILYMDAAWSLCQKGLLRPGPRRANAEVTRDGLGKGYALTPAGRERIQHAVIEMPSRAGVL